jgi:diguanylate cyclase (GGDEF)-like protein/hemerythrin-like metal-binding protein/PAS domain S-box-containing protein
MLFSPLTVENYREVIEKAGVGLAVLDQTCRFVEINSAFSKTTGYSREEMLAPNFRLAQLSLSEDIAIFVRNMALVSRGGADSYRLLRQFTHKENKVVWVEWVFNVLHDVNGKPHFFVLTAIDITEQKRVESELSELSFFDPLTKLANRRLLQDRLQTVLARARRDGCNVALLFIDLDHFKPVNDSLGHEVGDWLLKSVARRLLDCLRAYDTAARFGGDEFVILLPDLVQPEDAMQVAKRILAALSEPFVTNDGKRLLISGSIGISLYPDHADSEGELLRAGDEAMYMAKKSGRNRIVCLEQPTVVKSSRPFQEEAYSGLVHLRWDQKYSSGNVLIDTEHHELFRQSNQLLDFAMSSAVRPEAVRTSLQQLVHLVDIHFQHEEKLLAEWQFPDRVEHARQHSRLLDHARQIILRMEEPSIPTGELLNFLIGEMIHDHILSEDSNYFHLVRNEAPS